MVDIIHILDQADHHYPHNQIQVDFILQIIKSIPQIISLSNPLSTIFIYPHIHLTNNIMQNPSKQFQKRKQTPKQKKDEAKIEIQRIISAQKLIIDKNHIVKESELMYSENLSDKYGAKIYLKREDRQRGRTFKIRGAYYKYLISNESVRQAGYVCASDGNFAQALSLVSGKFKVKVVVYVPEVCNKTKIQNMRRFGGQYTEVRTEGANFEQSAHLAVLYAKQNKMTFVHPFADIDVITGYATMGIEIIEDIPTQVDFLLVPSGGGGLLSGLSSYFKDISPSTHICAVEPENANPMYLSLSQNKMIAVEPSRYCDGSSVKMISKIAFDNCKQTVDSFVTVSEGEISQTILSLYTQGIITEPSGAMSVAALQKVKAQIKDKTVVCIVSGANTDLSRLDQAQEKSLTAKGEKNFYILNIPNKQGIVYDLFQKCIGENDTITSIEYRKKPNKETSQALVSILSTKKQQADQSVEKMKQTGITPENINFKSEILDLFF